LYQAKTAHLLLEPVAKLLLLLAVRLVGCVLCS
jgi:hypothetical protein